MKKPTKAIPTILAILVMLTPALFEGHRIAERQPLQKTIAYPESLQTMMELPSRQLTTPSVNQTVRMPIPKGDYHDLVEKLTIMVDLLRFLHNVTGDEDLRIQSEFYAHIINMAKNASQLNEEELVTLVSQQLFE